MTEETVTMKTLVGVRLYAIYLMAIYFFGSLLTMAMLHQTLGFRNGDVLRLEDKVRYQDEQKTKAQEECDARVTRWQNELRGYQRAVRIESDKADCIDLARSSKDVSVEGCMDRRAKEWPLP
jgi:hypothetical protein